MKTLLFVIGASILFSFQDRAKAQSAQPLPSKETRDKGLLMLQEFVIDAGDLNLGFADSASVMRAQIDTSSPVCFYYYVGDSLYKHSPKVIDQYFISIGKVAYPVVMDGRICASISFNNASRGWTPSEFQDSTELLTYYNTSTFAKIQQLSENGKTLLVAYLPAIHHYVLLEQSKDSLLLTSPNVLDTATANKFYPPTLSFLNKPRIPVQEFAVKHRQHVVAESARLQRHARERK